jgi:hypothetical protein
MSHATLIKRFAVVLMLVIISSTAVIMPVLAQEPASMNNTITVVGTGTATAQPDQAVLDIGVEFPDMDVAAAYTQVNSTLSTIVEALVALGVAREDIQTSGINIYSEPYGEMNGVMQNRFRASNRLTVIVRDLQLIEEVIDSAVASGANSIYGLQLGISDTQALESQARTAALENARARAEEIAGNIGVTLGDVVTVVEYSGAAPMPALYAERAYGGGGGTVFEPGQMSVSLSVQVSFSFNR